MTGRTSGARIGVALVLSSLAGFAAADGTPAGTLIENTATVNFDLAGTPVTQTSNTTRVTVAERVDVSVSLQSPQRLVAAGATDQPLRFTVVNTGNGSEAFTLAINSVVTGDDFDPLPSAVAIYFDSDASGDFSAGDQPYVPGNNDPLLAADASVDVFIVNDIPGSVSNGQLGFSELIVTAATGSGAPGTSYPGQGDGGVAAIVGSTGATATVAGEYFVSDVQVAIAKSQVVADPFGGNEPVPGATITYTLIVDVTTGTATAAVVRDPIPTFTSYVAGSLTLNAAALSDAADTDAGELDTSSAPEIVVRLGDLSPTDGTQTIEFTVVID